MFVFVFCFFVLVFVLQMPSIKKKATKKSLKRLHTSWDSFRNDNANMTFLDHYKRAPIVLKRAVDLESLEGTFILDVFKERTWTKLLNLMGDVFENIIQKFFANAIVEGDHINYWLRGKEFSITRCKVMIYNYVLCWLYSMTKSVVVALILFFVFCGILLY